MPRPVRPHAPLLAAAALALSAAGCAAQGGVSASPRPVRADDVRATVTALAADSMQGRAVATAGGERAARFIAAELARYGVRPAGDSAFFQWVPLAAVTRADGRRRLQLVGADTLDRVPAERRTRGINVVGVIPGADPVLREEAVLVAAHYDHLGVGGAVDGDSVYNGADDNASGVTAVMEVGRALARGPAPRRTVVLLLSTGEETGLLGTRRYLERPAVPLERTVANLAVEMIGRPDSLAGGAGRGWLTGFERSTMGALLRDATVPIVADPRPAENFFERSDNIAFAWRGIPAHTLSSYGMHRDYHTPADEADRLDVEHMTGVIDAAVRAVRLLADGPAPRWNPGGRPTPPQR